MVSPKETFGFESKGIWSPSIFIQQPNTRTDSTAVAQLHHTPSLFGLIEDRGDLESLFGFDM